MSGRLVRTLLDQEMTGGNHEYVLDAPDLPAGVYLYRMRAGRLERTEKLILVE